MGFYISLPFKQIPCCVVHFVEGRFGTFSFAPWLKHFICTFIIIWQKDKCCQMLDKITPTLS
jgi:hypothetical protein